MHQSKGYQPYPTDYGKFRQPYTKVKTEHAKSRRSSSKIQALPENILRLANSTHFGSSTRFISVVDAITRIGLREIGTLANATLMIDTFEGMKLTFDYQEFWSQSLQAPEVATVLADQNAEKFSLLPTEAFMLELLTMLKITTRPIFYE